MITPLRLRALLFPLVFALPGSFAAEPLREIPLPPVATSLPSLPGPDALPSTPGLPEVLTLNDGTHVTSPAQWPRRRAEIREILEYYAVGRVPPPPGNVRGRILHSETVAAGGVEVRYQLVHLTFGPDAQLALDIGLFTPAAGGPFPAIIHPGGIPPGAQPLPRLPPGANQGRGEDALAVVGPPPSVTAGEVRPPPGAADLAAAHAEVFRRGYALAIFNHNDCAEDTTLRRPDGSWAFRDTRFFPAYPGYDWGILGAWAWGASRIADYLETEPSIDKTKLIVSGVSRTGKAALIAAAFDERLVGAPVVTGGGGVGAYRFCGPRGSETLDVMETKYPNWFSPHLRAFRGRVDRLPFDEHWFLALCAPRPFLALEGLTDKISLPAAVRESFRAAEPAYALLGAPGRLGVNYGHHGHAFTDEDWTAMLDFADRHFFGKPIPRTFDRFPTDEELDAAASATTGNAVFNVRDFGAVGDGVTKDTTAFQRALDACAVRGGGEVRIPAGRYLIGSIQLGQRTTMRLEKDSVLVGSPDLADYPLIDIRWEGRWQPGHRALIHAADVDHIGIVGPGAIEGNAATAASNRPPRGTLVLEALHCTDVRWEGFTVHQPGNNWATHPTFCRDVAIKRLTIRGQRDGIDIDSCSRVRIEDCDIETGDDSISLKSGRGLDGARLGRPTEDVLIARCRLVDRRFACIGIGSEISGGVRDVRIEQCEFTAATHAIYLKSRIGRAGVSERISGRDLVVHGGGFLRINLATAGNTNTADDAVEGAPGVPPARELSFAHVRLEHAAVVVDATRIPAEQPLDGLVLHDIGGTAEKGILLRHLRRVALSDVKVEISSGPPLAIEDVSGAGLEPAAVLPPDTKS